MKKIGFLAIFLLIAFISYTQVKQVSYVESDLSKEVSRLKEEVSRFKEIIRELKENELLSDKAKYQKKYQLIVNGVEIIKEMHQGTVEIAAARSQNILYKKLIDVNNPSSEILGFQLLEVINKTLDENISLLPLVDTEKKRLKSSIGNLFEGLKKTFPPLQIITSAFSTISSFTSFNTKIEKLDKKVESVVVEATNPITKEIIQKINAQLQPYMEFYSALNKTNGVFETALYQHGVEYKDFIEEVAALKLAVEKKININQSIGSQVNSFFDLSNSSIQDFNYRKKMESDTINSLVGGCSNIFELVDRYKKFTNDFIIIQDDFYKSYIDLLKNGAKKLPYRDDAKIDQLLTELDNLKNGNPQQNLTGFDAGYKLRLQSILAKVIIINTLRL